MKVLIKLFLVLISPICVFATDAIEVADNTFKINSFGEEVFYFGFAEGDEIVFSFQEVNDNELKEIEIIEYPSSSKFMDFKTVFVQEKKIKVIKSGIYMFRFKNGAAKGRICKMNIKRIPISESTMSFNSTVYWKTVYDTTYTTVQEKYLVSRDTSFTEFYSSSAFISSQNAINGNANYQIVDFVIPQNTVSWSFYIGTGTEGKAEYERASAAFLKSATSIASKAPGYGPMAVLALSGVSQINKVQGADNVKYWFLARPEDVQLFRAGQSFQQYKKGDVVNEASQMKSPTTGKVYLALMNDNTIDPITVMIKATAFIVTDVWGQRPVQKMSVSSREVPYLMN